MKRLFLSLVAVAGLAALAQEVRPSRLDFTTQPDGASVVIDGTVRGFTPLTLHDVAPGRHHLKFELANHEPEDRFFSVGSEGEYVQQQATLEPVMGLLLVTTEPDGCDVSLDGRSLGETPRLITSLTAQGVHRLLLQKPGYQARTLEVKFAGRKPVVRHEKLILDSGVVNVTSSPAGAEVTVNGVVRGVTPVTVTDVAKGRATVTLKLAGYANATRELSLRAGDEQTLFIELEGNPGSLRLSAVPDTARLYVDGVAQGRGPVGLANLKPGDYVVRAELDGYGPVEKTVTVGNGQSVTEELRLESVMGRIEVRSYPVGAQVLLDGRIVGVTKSSDPNAEQSEVFAIENVLEGEHVVTVRKDGFAEKVKHPKVENRKTAQLGFKLERIFKPDVEIVTDTRSFRGVLVENTPDGVVVEVSPGVSKTFTRSEIRDLKMLSE